MTGPQRPALFCAAAHPLRPDLLCSRLSGHGGAHAGDDDGSWVDGWTTGEETTP